MGDMASIKELAARMNKGEVDALVILGVNVAYSAPADVKFTEGLSKVKEVIYLADQEDETAKALKDHKAAVVVPRAHSFEAWGDLVAIDGQVSIQQPLIAPLHGAISEVELLTQLMGEAQSGYRVVRGAWKSKVGATGFHRRWRRWLHAGVLEGQDAFTASSATARGVGSLKGSVSVALSETKLDVLFFAGHNAYDGRYANNSWLQELPDPMTKITWDNAALLSPATAQKLGVSDEEMVTIKVGSAEVKSVVWTMPGQADHTVVLSLGYGRPFENFLRYHEGSYHSGGVTGVDVNPLRSADQAFHT
jgi:molybdopterin-containing oxidoreductase family iron-sulfur binding subunit